MKITQVICQVLRVGKVAAKTASCQDAVLVRIRADDGCEGIGEADSSPEVVKAIVDAPFSHNIACGLRELLIGENPLETERLWQKMLRGTLYFGRTSVTMTAMAAVDMAVWDLKGKHFGEPIHRLLGGKRHDRIPAYASILFGRDGSETAEIGHRWREAGYSAIKFGWEPMGKSEALISNWSGARARESAMTERCSSTRASFGMRGPPCGGRISLPTTISAGWKSRYGPTTSTGMPGSAIDRRSLLPPGKGNAAAKRSAHSSIGTRSTCIKSTCRGAALPTRRTSRAASRRSAPAYAITVTPVR